MSFKYTTAEKQAAQDYSAVNTSTHAKWNFIDSSRADRPKCYVREFLIFSTHTHTYIDMQIYAIVTAERQKIKRRAKIIKNKKNKK